MSFLLRAVFRVWCVLLLSGLWASAVLAESSVWKVSKGEQHIYLGGTIHILSPSDYPLPPSFDSAYRQAQVLVFEADTEQLQTPENTQAMMRAMYLNDGSSLDKHLQPTTLAALRKHLSQRQLPEAHFLAMTPVGVGLTLAVMEFQLMGMTVAGVDDHFMQRAKADKKSVSFLETALEQIQFLAAMDDGREDAMLMQSLSDMEELPRMMDSMKSGWRAGDLNAINDSRVRRLKTQFPEMYEVMLTRRNNAWMPKIEAMFTDAPVEFVLVGALHLVDDVGLIAQLRRKGYRVEQLK